MVRAIRNSLKEALRMRMKKILNGLTIATMARQSKAVTLKILKHDIFRQAQRISIYLSTNQELNTTALVYEMFRLKKLVFVPTWEGTTMKIVRLQDVDDYKSLPLTKFNMKQPEFNGGREDAMLNGYGIDLFIVPGLAFTREGNRMGYGFGYYDRYLPQHALKYPNKKSTYMAVAYDEQIVSSEEMPLEPHDVSMHLVVTEKS